jgi:hypothetical protein
MPPCQEHEDKVRQTIEILRTQGYRAFPLKKLPDGIAVKDGKIIAIEILPRSKEKELARKKRELYNSAGFDEVIVDFYTGVVEQRRRYGRIRLSEMERRTLVRIMIRAVSSDASISEVFHAYTLARSLLKRPRGKRTRLQGRLDDRQTMINEMESWLKESQDQIFAPSGPSKA